MRVSLSLVGKSTRYFTIASAAFEQRVMLTTRFATERWTRRRRSPSG